MEAAHNLSDPEGASRPANPSNDGATPKPSPEKPFRNDYMKYRDEALPFDGFHRQTATSCRATDGCA